MDDLWQRYRSFWIPVLIGLGVFLVGLIAVHVATDDPKVENDRVEGQAKLVDRLVEPTSAQVQNIPKNAEEMHARVKDFAARLDQAQGADVLEYAVDAALGAAILRGATADEIRAAVRAPESAAGRATLAPFEGDATLAARSVQRYEATKLDRLSLLRGGDPNVGFSRLLNDVWSELKVRANRADVELNADALGFAGVVSVTRSALPQRLANLALISRLVDLGIRSGIRSVDEIRIDARPVVDIGETFLREWPITFTMRGDMASLLPVVSFLTNPQHTIPLTHLVLSQPPRGSPLEGIVQLNAVAGSCLVRPDASLDLEQEEQRQ